MHVHGFDGDLITFADSAVVHFPIGRSAEKEVGVAEANKLERPQPGFPGCPNRHMIGVVFCPSLPVR
jgi:hypothetical protein